MCLPTSFRCVSFVLVIGFCGTVRLHAEVKILRVKPDQTDPAITTVHGPSIALYDPHAPPRRQLCFFLVGTGDKATASLRLDTTFAKWGYHVISIDYEDNVIAVACAHSLDPTAFGRYREAIVTGAPVSAKVKVNRANSILNRFQKLLTYLVKHDPNGGWNQFVKDGRPVWSRIVVAGHSQGSGHAAYIGKLFKVDRVLMFSGPQDYMDNLHRPAPWQGMESATPPDRFFAFLALKDPFNVHHQLENCMMLMHLSKPETLAIEPGEVIHGDWHILINNFPTEHPHGSTLLLQFTNVWNYMVTANDK
jgi:hypothetical protein